MSAQIFPQYHTMPTPPPSPLMAQQNGLQDLTDLSRQMSEHSLSRSKRLATPPLLTPPLLTPPIESDPSPTWSIFSTTSPFDDSPAFNDLSSPISSTTSEPAQPLRRSQSPPLHLARYHSSGLRRSRQDAVRAQCSSSHLLEISRLVARMVETGDQCTVCTPVETSPTGQYFPEQELQEEVDSMDIEDDEEAKEGSNGQAGDNGSVSSTPVASRRTSTVGSGTRDSRYCISKQRPDLSSRRRNTRKTTI